VTVPAGVVDGTLEHLGRLTTKSKGRGFRVELGEIETILASTCRAPGAVHLWTGQGGTMCASSRAAASERPGCWLRSACRSICVPRCPSTWFRAFHCGGGDWLLPNGKVDRRRLSDVGAGGEPDRRYEAPADPVEVTIPRSGPS